jgi:hypothetical protein
MPRLATIVAALVLATACGAEPAPVEAPPVATPAVEAAPIAAPPVAPTAAAGTLGDVAVCCEVNDMEVRPGGVTKVPNWMLDAAACAGTDGALVDKAACAAAPRPAWMDEAAK